MENKRAQRLGLTGILVFVLAVITAGTLAVAFGMQAHKHEQTPASPALEQSDFRIFGGNYAAQVSFGFKPRKDVTAVILTRPIDWNMDPFKDANWRFQLSAWRMLNPIWSKWYDKDWHRLTDEILPWVADWSRYHVDEQKASAFEWYDMATGLRAQNLAMLFWLADQGKIDLSANQMSMLRRLASLHVEKLRDPDFINRGNHGIFQIQGLRLLCITSKVPECKGEQPYSSQMMEALFDAQFDPSGVQTENSPGYHLFSVRAFERIRPALFPDISTKLRQSLGKARQVGPWFTEPDGYVVQIGDTDGGDRPMKGHDSSGPFVRNFGADQIADLHESGYVIIRSSGNESGRGASMLVVAGPTSDTKVHDHADELSFVLFTAGRYLFVDSGKYTYNKNAWRSYFVSDVAHNVAGVLGKAFLPRDTRETKSTLNATSFETGKYSVSGCVHRGNDFATCRTYLYRPDQELVVTDKFKKLPVEGQPAIYWHLDPSLMAELKSGDVVISRPGGKQLASMHVSEPRCRSSIVKGQTVPSIQGWVSHDYKKRVAAPVVLYVCDKGVTEVKTRVALLP